MVMALSLRLARSLRPEGQRRMAKALRAGSRPAPPGVQSLQSRIASILDEVSPMSQDKSTESTGGGSPRDLLYERVGKLADERAPPPQLVSTPEKVMIFIDGTWLFYNLHRTKTRENSEIVAKFGKHWDQNYAVDWSAIPRLVSSHVAQQMQLHSGYQRPVDVKRTVMYTAAAANTQDSDTRKVMMHECVDSNFDVTCFVTRGSSDDERNGTKIKEKCVDIGLAVDMLYMAFAGGAVDAYDTAVLLTGDKDFIPAMEKTRLVGKKVVLCSMRSSCSKDLARSELGATKIRDFDVLWLDDHLDSLLVKKSGVEIIQRLVRSVERIIDAEGSVDPEAEDDETRYMSFRQLGRRLDKISFGDGDKDNSLLDTIKKMYRSMYRFVESNSDKFTVKYKEELYPDFMICLNDGSAPAEVADPNPYRFEPPDGQYRFEPPDETDAEDDESAFFGGGEGEGEDSGDSAYEEMTKINLRERCKALGLKMGGTKAEIVRRLMEHVPREKKAGKKERAKAKAEAAKQKAEESPRVEKDKDHNGSHHFSMEPQGVAPVDKEAVLDFLRIKVMGHLLGASGRSESGRMLGRYLKSLIFEDGSNALELCKRDYGSLGDFLARQLPEVRKSERRTGAPPGDRVEYSVEYSLPE